MTASHGKDQNILLVTLGLVDHHRQPRALSVDVDDAHDRPPLRLRGRRPRLRPRADARARSRSSARWRWPALLWLLIARTDLGRAIRAVAKERQGARLVGIDVEHIYAMSFGIGTACLAVAACLLMPTFYVTPQVGYAFVLIAFTTVVLGGMGSFDGALVGGLVLGVIEALGGLLLGESLGQIGIFLIFILVLLFRPTGPVRKPARMKAWRGILFVAAAAALLRFAARPAVRGLAQLLDHDAPVRVARAIVERARRLWRSVLVRSCRVLRRRRLCDRHAAGAASASTLVAAAAAIVAGALVGAFIGALCFRYGLRGSYFALVTLAFAEVFRILASSLAITGGGLRHPDPA